VSICVQAVLSLLGVAIKEIIHLMHLISFHKKTARRVKAVPSKTQCDIMMFDELLSEVIS
jgi:hypothetical protein